jgi:hypothetical protein
MLAANHREPAPPSFASAILPGMSVAAEQRGRLAKTRSGVRLLEKEGRRADARDAICDLTF